MLSIITAIVISYVKTILKNIFFYKILFDWRLSSYAKWHTDLRKRVQLGYMALRIGSILLVHRQITDIMQKLGHAVPVS